MLRQADNRDESSRQSQDNADARLDELINSHVVLNGSTNVTDGRAQEEAISIAEGLDLEGKRKEHKRHQTFRDHANTAVLVVLWIIVLMLLLGILIFAFHALSPLAWHFLNGAQLAELKSMLATAILSSALTGYANRRMS